MFGPPFNNWTSCDRDDGCAYVLGVSRGRVGQFYPGTLP